MIPGSANQTLSGVSTLPGASSRKGCTPNQFAEAMSIFSLCSWQPNKRVFVTPYPRRRPFGFSHFPDLPMAALYRIGGVDQLADGGSVLKIAGQLLPVVFPALDNNRVFLPPFFR